MSGVRPDRYPAPRPDQLQAAFLVWLLVYLGFMVVTFVPLTWLYGVFLGALQSAIGREAVGRAGHLLRRIPRGAPAPVERRHGRDSYK